MNFYVIISQSFHFKAQQPPTETTSNCEKNKLGNALFWFWTEYLMMRWKYIFSSLLLYMCWDAFKEQFSFSIRITWIKLRCASSRSLLSCQVTWLEYWWLKTSSQGRIWRLTFFNGTLVLRTRYSNSICCFF